jgi:hypothetical protein
MNINKIDIKNSALKFDFAFIINLQCLKYRILSNKKHNNKSIISQK